MPYVIRFAAYELSKCPGHEREAYAELMRLYHLGEDQHLPTLIVQIKAMEDFLDIPRDQRIPDEHPDVARARRDRAAAEAREKARRGSPDHPVLPGTSRPLPGQPSAPEPETAPDTELPEIPLFR
jgi:hypothetical protein